MSETKPRVLVFGAGVIGSLYALRFAKTGIDVTVLARGRRLEQLENGLRYIEEGIRKSEPVKVIETLADNDVYDFIFAAVRCDQAVGALNALKTNKSPTIVTLTNAVGYDEWLSIVGGRLLPGFPGAGGDMKDGVLAARFVGKTLFGEINGQKSARTSALSWLLEAAGLPYSFMPNITAFHISHATVTAANKAFYTETGVVDAKTAMSRPILMDMAGSIKRNVGIIKAANAANMDKTARMFDKLPAWSIAAMFGVMLRFGFIRDVMLGDHALAARGETMLLARKFDELAAK